MIKSAPIVAHETDLAQLDTRFNVAINAHLSAIQIIVRSAQIVREGILLVFTL